MSRILANLVVQVNAASVAVPPPRPPSPPPFLLPPLRWRPNRDRERALIGCTRTARAECLSGSALKRECLRAGVP